MRLLVLALVLAVPVIATEYPLWDGEPIEEYTKKVGLPPTKTLDLGNGVTMECPSYYTPVPELPSNKGI